MSAKLDDLEEKRNRRKALSDQLEVLRRDWRLASEERREQILKESESIKAEIANIPLLVSLAGVVREYGEEYVLDHIMLMLSWVNDQLNIGEKMNVEQIETTSVGILERAKNVLGLEDLAAICRAGVQGEYGKIYNRLDMAVIMEWISQYETRLFDLRIDYAISRHAERKESLHERREMDERRLRYLLNNQNRNL